jgi:hypothetical protein
MMDVNAATEEKAADMDRSGLMVTPKASGKHRPYRRIVHYDRSGPFHRQVGIKIIAGRIIPMMQTYFVHAFRHATKGPRVYTGGPNIRLPYAPPAASPVLAFYGGLRARKKRAIELQQRAAAERALQGAYA